mmetsp:Transcript_104927/g.334025  ORF Transcript_104927/g.334025 Transcript_104927/m.334025 type:complete len:297 (-) Transcript_104927:153-1043(-)
MGGFDSLPAKMSIGALGGCGAAVFCHPLDVVRVTMQVSEAPRGSLQTGLAVFKEAGLRRGLYSGLSAAFLRQWTYGAGRVGIYSYLLGREERPASVSFGRKIGFGMVSGGVGSLLGTPAELALVRMSADARLPVSERRGRGVHRVLAAVAFEEGRGVAGMWQGAGPTIVRAMVISSVSLAVMSECKARLPGQVDFLAQSPTANMVTSTVVGAFFAILVSQPLDVVKSRLQNMGAPGGGAAAYAGPLDCAAKSLRSEGPLVFMRGFTPSFLKFSPYNAISLTLAEKLTQVLTGKSAF